MTEILDTIFSSFIIMMILALALLILFVGLSFKDPFKNSFLNKTYKLLMYVCAGSFFFIGPFFNYGHAVGFGKIAIGKTTVCLYEKHVRARARSAGRDARINILDKSTGKRKVRLNAGRPGVFIGMRNDTICFMDDKEIVLYDAANLKEIYRIKEGAWATVSPEFSVGVEDMDVTDETSDYDVNHYVALNCLNGKKYWFEPFSKTVIGNVPTIKYHHNFANRSSEIVIKLSYEKELKYLYVSDAGNDRLKTILPGPNGKGLFSKIDSATYIEPFLLCMDTLKKVFVFGHYLTTKKEDYYLEAKDFGYNTLWKKLSSELVDNDSNILSVWMYKDDILYFNIGGYIFAIDPLTFKVYWSARL